MEHRCVTIRSSAPQRLDFVEVCCFVFQMPNKESTFERSVANEAAQSLNACHKLEFLH
jgi:hypothetical protein